ncbi:MAG TPA: DNA-binding protein [Acetomicrobium flavidum]|uniref:PPC domain-containing DNA-binding protein n=1 Tax=Acetomicrobium flavidum TaxID=49896 RepID=UPI002B5B5441|nr:DNA-binding protein [Acetomicrobium flavidum]HOM31696.1 DNA-binding protein [Acetomicrobium flavidum]
MSGKSIYVRNDNYLIVRLRDGDDFFERLTAVLEEEKIRSAILVSAVGMMRDVEIGWFGGEEYQKKTLSEPMELLSMTGSVNEKEDGSLFMHLHVVLGSSELNTVGGHLFRATVHQTNELVFLLPRGITLKRLTEGEGLLRLFPELKR